MARHGVLHAAGATFSKKDWRKVDFSFSKDGSQVRLSASAWWVLASCVGVLQAMLSVGVTVGTAGRVSLGGKLTLCVANGAKSMADVVPLAVDIKVS
jgi:hypothetical protein